MPTYVSNCGGDERGRGHGGQAGDQTRREYRVREWYDFDYTYVLRLPDRERALELAKLARAAAENDNIGYDQWERETIWRELVRAGYDPAHVSRPCEADCSSSTVAMLKCLGFRTGDVALQALPMSLYTGDMRPALVAAGLEQHTARRYMDSGDYLLAGDICLHERNHVNIVITDGAKAAVPEREDDDMALVIKPSHTTTHYYFDGGQLHAIGKQSELDALNKARKAAGGSAFKVQYWGKDEFLALQRMLDRTV